MKKSFTILFISTIIYFMIVPSSCLKHKAEPGLDYIYNCSDTISFSTTIIPLLTTHCNESSCHNSSDNAGGYSLESHLDVSSHADISLRSMEHVSGVSNMPKSSSKLDKETREKFACWIEQGKLNN